MLLKVQGKEVNKAHLKERNKVHTKEQRKAHMKGLLYAKAWKARLKGLATYRPNPILGAVLETTPAP